LRRRKRRKKRSGEKGLLPNQSQKPKPKSLKPSSSSVKLTKDEEIQESLDRLKNQGKYVKLNVGGSLHYTTLGTLTNMTICSGPCSVGEFPWRLMMKARLYTSSIV